MADNPIKYKDFIQPDSSVTDLIKQLETLQTTYADMIKNVQADAKKMQDSMKEMNNVTSEGQEETKKAATQADKLSKAYEQLKQSQSNAGIELAKLKQTQKEQNQITRLELKLNSAKEGSYDKLSAQYSLNKIRLNAMSKAQRDNTKAGQELEKQTADIYEEMKRLQEATGKHTLSVGDYQKGWSGVTEQLGQLPGAAGAAAGGLKGLGAQAKALLANPIILLIAGIVGGLTALFKLFKKTKTGSDALAKAGAYLNGIFSFMVGLVDTLVDGLKAVFEDPIESMKKFWEALKKNVVNRLLGLVDAVKALGKLFKALWERDMEGLKNAAKEAGTALIQMQTGLDEEQQKKFADKVRETTKALSEQAQAFANLKTAQLEARRANRELEKSIEDITTQEELLKTIRDDATKSFAEREQAAQQAADLIIQRTKDQQTIAKTNLDLINRELDLRQANGEQVEDLLDTQLEAYKTLRQAERDYLLSVRENQKEQSQLVQDRLERDLDILIDGFDNQKTINERIINDDKRTFQERQQVLNQTKDLFEETFNKQIETIQKFTDVQIDANDLINESDAVALNQKIRNLGLSEIIEGRLLEIVRERRTAIQDLAESESTLNQAQRDAAQRTIDQQYDLALSEIDLLKSTEAEKTKLRLEAEKDRLEKILKLNETMGQELTKTQIQTIKNTIAKIDQEINSNANKDYDLYSLAGINLDDEKKAAISESTQFAIDNVNAFLQAKIDAAQGAVDAADKETQAAQNKLDAEIEARNNGYAANVANAQKELDLAKKNQEKALKEQEKAQKAQAAIQTIQQVGNLITASAKIWGTLGFPFAIPALAIMWGSFAAAKIKANQVTKQQKFGEGDFEILRGGSHQSGNDISLGVHNGVERIAEGGEALAIIKKSQTRKYRKILPNIISSLNKGVFEQMYGQAYDMGGMAISTIQNTSDLRQLEDDVKTIRKQGERKYYTDGQGRMIEQYKNLRRVYAN